MSQPRMNREELELERRFLLDSIRDLEREREVGDVADGDYRALRDGYVARAAAVMREIDGEATTEPSPARPWWRRLAISVATLLVAVAIGIFVAQSAGQRLPGQGLTGGQPADEVAVQLTEARRLLNSGDLVGSLKLYERVLDEESGNVEATTYSAWLAVLMANEAGDAAGVQDGVRLLAEATRLDQTYADPHCLLAVALHNFIGESDPALVQQEVDACLALDPPADMVPLIEQLVAE